MTRARRAEPVGIAIAVLLAAAAGVVAWDASSITLTPTYGVGPKLVPILVAIGLLVLALANLLLAWRGEPPAAETADRRALVLILGGLAALIAVIGLDGGFIVATAILFAATTTAFGRRAPFTDFGIGLALALIVYLVFARLLTLSLPIGPIERLL
ncbi:MAG: tripartite tricarboxylate transporter TctB family protein [Proteobacteria bacterium]|nr:tripartite tricarboxylate transporter TctB family protein [Pseudomonadota bacterium]